MFVPQVVPSATGVPVSSQTGAAVRHEVVPVWQGLLGLQAAAGLQMEQAPLAQSMLVPQGVPFGRIPISAQIGTPVLQLIAPARQRLEDIQVTPAVHGTHVPLLQTRFAPQTVPFMAVADSAQTGTPVSHWVVPVRQG